MTINFNFTPQNANTYNIVSATHHTPHTPAPTLVTLLQKPKIYHGYMNGFRQPVAEINLQVLSFYPPQAQSLQKALLAYADVFCHQFRAITSSQDLVQTLGDAVVAIQKAAQHPVFESAKIEIISDKKSQFELWIPFSQEQEFHYAFSFMMQFIIHHLAAAPTLHGEAIKNEISSLIQRLKNPAPGTMPGNNLRFLEAAHQENIPWCHIEQNIYQYGHGKKSHWFESTFTDNTSHLATGLARNKYAALKVLKKSGLPVPEQYIVANETEALTHAKSLGYPVVIKPHNTDGGTGVHALINSDTQVLKSYANARQYSQTVLVEKHIVGKDYRLIVLNGKLIWAIERIPAGITGDGKQSIHELILNTNQERAKENKLYQIQISEEVNDFLAEQGMDINTIPAANQFVVVARIANIAKGGIPVAVFNDVHPENKQLAEMAANIMRLDLAGIDIILPDIKSSWQETGGAIIEINAQPQLGIVTAAHVYKEILKMLVPDCGRIPVCVVYGNADDIVKKLHIQLSGKYGNVAIANDFNTARGVLFNPSVDALIYCITKPHDQGLPFDRYHHLFFAASFLSENIMYEKPYIQSLFNACTGTQIISQHAIAWLQKLKVNYKSDMILHNLEDYHFNMLCLD